MVQSTQVNWQLKHCFTVYPTLHQTSKLNKNGTSSCKKYLFHKRFKMKKYKNLGFIASEKYPSRSTSAFSITSKKYAKSLEMHLKVNLLEWEHKHLNTGPPWPKKKKKEL